jgi:hypothetical protein
VGKQEKGSHTTGRFDQKPTSATKQKLAPQWLALKPNLGAAAADASNRHGRVCSSSKSPICGSTANTGSHHFLAKGFLIEPEPTDPAFVSEGNLIVGHTLDNSTGRCPTTLDLCFQRILVLSDKLLHGRALLPKGGI